MYRTGRREFVRLRVSQRPNSRSAGPTLDQQARCVDLRLPVQRGPIVEGGHGASEFLAPLAAHGPRILLTKWPAGFKKVLSSQRVEEIGTRLGGHPRLRLERWLGPGIIWNLSVVDLIFKAITATRTGDRIGWRH